MNLVLTAWRILEVLMPFLFLVIYPLLECEDRVEGIVVVCTPKKQYESPPHLPCCPVKMSLMENYDSGGNPDMISICRGLCITISTV